jgi:hypothetical protein
MFAMEGSESHISDTVFPMEGSESHISDTVFPMEGSESHISDAVKERTKYAIRINIFKKSK